MNPGIHLSKLWSDDTIIELQVDVSDGRSYFSNEVYLGSHALEETVSRLLAFRDQVHGGLLDLRFGEFGQEYANGAFRARFHLAAPGRLFVSCEQESAFAQFGKKEVASRATLYVESEPVLLDRFISGLQAMADGGNQEAHLDGI